jgi:hypothetical protein
MLYLPPTEPRKSMADKNSIFALIVLVSDSILPFLLLLFSGANHKSRDPTLDRAS